MVLVRVGILRGCNTVLVGALRLRVNPEFSRDRNLGLED